MYRSNRIIFGILILILYAFCCIQSCSISGHTRASYSPASVFQDDTLAPIIHSWDHTEVIADEYFLIWANVTDDDSGILNVTAVADVVSGRGNDSIFSMEFNGSFFVTNDAILVANTTYRLWIESYDNALNYVPSFVRSINLNQTDTEDVTKDPNLTMPYVIGSTVALLTVMVLIAFYYSRKLEPK